MDIKKFQESRSSRKEELRDGYIFLIGEYNQALIAAIQETNPTKQQALISRVLQINKEITEHVRTFIAEINKGTGDFDPKTLEDLTADLVKYQEQYIEIQSNKNRLETLKYIYSFNKGKLESTTNMYNIYLGVLALLIFIILFLVIRTAWSDTVYSTITKPLGGRR